jgi:ATP-dependent Clp protease ATP-binding subunit ClpX
MIYNKTNAELLKEFDRHVIGHTKAKKALIKLVNRSKTAHYHKYLAENKTEEIETLSCLLVGPSGTGKTHLVNTLQKMVNFPLIRVDATNLGPDGSSASKCADDVVKEITNNAQLLAQSSYDYHSAYGALDQTIVFIDEFDKLANEWESSGSWQRRTQATLLKLLESDDGLQNVSFIMAGAFGGIEQVQESSNTESKIGFSSQSAGKVEKVDTITDRDIIKYGIMPELVGRISSIEVLDILNAETMRTILDETIIPQKIDQLRLFMNVDNMSITNDQRNKLVETAMESGQGARSLKRGVEDILTDLEFNYEVVDDVKLIGGM